MRRREFMFQVSTAMTAARALRAQQRAMPLIGFLNPTSPGSLAPFVAAFRHGLSEAGYVEGQDVAIEYRWAEGHTDRLPALAADLVSRKVDVIASTGGNAPALAAKNATSTIPIVFVIGSDPVVDGLVASLARPGGNLTGFTLLGDELTPKRLELLSELVPQARRIALLVNPNNPEADPTISDTQNAAQAKGVHLHILKPAQKVRSTPPSALSPRCKPRHSSSTAIRSSTPNASSSSRWHHAVPFRQSIPSASSPLRAA